MSRKKLPTINGARFTGVGLCFCPAGGILFALGSPVQGEGTGDLGSAHACRGNATMPVRTVEEP